MTTLTVLFALSLSAFALADLYLSAGGIGFGQAIPGLGSVGFGVSTGGVSSAGSAAAGGNHVSSTTIVSPHMQQPQVSKESPEADLSVLANLEEILSRPVQQAVPDYRNGVPGKSVIVKRKVKKHHAAKDAHKVCWTISKRCCYEEVQKGYRCRDFYDYKYARCHPVIDFEERCGELLETPQHHPKPKERTKWEESIIKNYDANYGPHVHGYPNGGESEYYVTDVIPNRPHGVTGNPYPAPAGYESKPHGTSATNGYSNNDSKYHTTAPPSTTANKYTPPPTVTPTVVTSTTVAPATTTAAPTTVAPTTFAPTTFAPTTVASTTFVSTNVASTTFGSTTVAPTTFAPTTTTPSTSSTHSHGGNGYTKPSPVSRPQPDVTVTSGDTQNGYKPSTTQTVPTATAFAQPAQPPNSPVGSGQTYRAVQGGGAVRRGR